MLPACDKACSHRRQLVDICKASSGIRISYPCVQTARYYCTYLTLFLETYQSIKPGKCKELYRQALKTEQPLAKLDNRTEMYVSRHKCKM